MYFKITKHFVKGSKRGSDETSIVKFLNEDKVTTWAERMSLDCKGDYVIIDIVKANRYDVLTIGSIVRTS